jgi:AcrR family transcriptional regulator
MSAARATVATRAARARSRRGEGDRLREEILAATTRLLIESGDEDAVSIRAIARAVGVTPPAIYLHFADKEDLILSVCERHFATFDAQVEDAGRSTPDPVESLRRRARAYLRFGVENPEHYRILFMGRHRRARDPDRLPGRDAFDHLVEAVARAVAAERFAPDLDPFVAAVGLWAAVHGLTSALISMPSFPWPDVNTLLDHVCTVHLRGLTAAHRSEGNAP